jgi:hypothetical protein
MCENCQIWSTVFVYGRKRYSVRVSDKDPQAEHYTLGTRSIEVDFCKFLTSVTVRWPARGGSVSAASPSPPVVGNTSPWHVPPSPYGRNSFKENKYLTLKGQCHEIFDFCFFHESVSPKPLSTYSVRAVSIFVENSRRYSLLMVSLRPVANEEKSLIRKILIILLGHLWIVELTYI